MYLATGDLSTDEYLYVLKCCSASSEIHSAAAFSAQLSAIHVTIQRTSCISPLTLVDHDECRYTERTALEDLEYHLGAMQGGDNAMAMLNRFNSDLSTKTTGLKSLGCVSSHHPSTVQVGAWEYSQGCLDVVDSSDWLPDWRVVNAMNYR